MDINSLKVLFTSLPGRYAHALFNEGKKSACLEEISEDFGKLDKYFNENIQVRKLMTNCLLNKKDLNDCLIALGQYLSFCPVFLSFIRQVIANQRFCMMKRMRYIYQVALVKYKNRRIVTVLSVVELLPEQKTRIEKLIRKALDEKVIINYDIDERILGGIKLRSEELDVDVSFASQLSQLARYFKNMKLRLGKNES
ncbi:MAG: ATP synthase F1 subunit delta [Holosporales bacterium]|nr:ATP synthase F1 subunit delta [Holosporales bacterium]